MFHPQYNHLVAHILQANKVRLQHRMGHLPLELMQAQDPKVLLLVLHKLCQGLEVHQAVLLLLDLHQRLHRQLHQPPEETLLHHHLVRNKRVTIPNIAQDRLVLLVQVSS